MSQKKKKKKKDNVKTPDTIFYYAYWAYQIVFFWLVINIILGVMSCHDHLRWIFSYTQIFLRIPTAYTQASFAISCHAYRFYAYNIADMIMA